MAAFLGLVTTWVSRCGIWLYWVSSTRLGSIRIMRTCSGVERIRIDVMIELMHDDLPAPVWPAMSRWGMVARFISTEVPEMSRPTPTSSGWVARRASSEVRMSPRATTWRSSLGTSTPMAWRPGMGAMMRTSGDAMA